jgi:hypothetical protein
MRSACLVLVVLGFSGLCFAQETGNAPETNAPAQAQAQSDDRPKSIADSINVTWADEQRDFTDLADAMPEAKWNFKPTSGEFKDVRTFAEQVKHVACANEGFAKELQGQAPPEGCEKGGPNPAKSKAELMDYLRASFQMLDDQINGLDEKNQMQPVDGPYGGPNTRIGMAVLAAWHVADHYGQLVEYARMNGIVPPASRPQPPPSK